VAALCPGVPLLGCTLPPIGDDYLDDLIMASEQDMLADARAAGDVPEGMDDEEAMAHLGMF
jgi:hypothetical protein